MEGLQVRMLGRFSIEAQGRRIDDSENRSQKPWLLLAYLLYHRGRVVAQEELLRLCWGNEEIKGDPANTLRVVLHRTRAMLDKLEVMPGRELILRSRDGFQWNDRLPTRIDVEEFEALYAAGKAAGDQEEKRSCFEQAIDRYEGDFLSRNAGEHWVQCMAGRFRAMYMEMALEMLDILSLGGEEERAAALCRRALAVEPYNEELYRRLMTALLAQGRPEEAAERYEELRAKLLARFDRTPEEKTGAVYFKAIQMLNPPEVPITLKRPDADEEGEGRGARVCDFAFFRMFYTSAEWLIIQCGLNVCSVLFTVEDGPGKAVSERMLERVMENLTQQLRLELRRGDVIARCADRQIIGMVQAQGYEEACAICERQVEKFYRDHPHTPIRLRYGIWRVGGNNA